MKRRIRKSERKERERERERKGQRESLLVFLSFFQVEGAKKKKLPPPSPAAQCRSSSRRSLSAAPALRTRACWCRRCAAGRGKGGAAAATWRRGPRGPAAASGARRRRRPARRRSPRQLGLWRGTGGHSLVLLLSVRGFRCLGGGRSGRGTGVGGVRGVRGGEVRPSAVEDVFFAFPLFRRHLCHANGLTFPSPTHEGRISKRSSLTSTRGAQGRSLHGVVLTEARDCFDRESKESRLDVACVRKRWKGKPPTFQVMLRFRILTAATARMETCFKSWTQQKRTRKGPEFSAAKARRKERARGR